MSDEGGRSGVEERSGKIVAPSVCPPREMQERHVGIQSTTHDGDVVAKTGKATEQLCNITRARGGACGQSNKHDMMNDAHSTILR